MLFLVGSEARRRQGRFLSDGVLMVLAMVFVAVVAVGVIALTTDWFSSSARETPSQTETMETAPVVIPPAQTEPEVAAPVTIPVLQVVWKEVKNPTLPPAEQGFYSGHPYIVPGGGTRGQMKPKHSQNNALAPCSNTIPYTLP